MSANLIDLFREYEALLRWADTAFRGVQEEYPDCVRCRSNCSDCCHAFFELFQIEAVYLNYNFNRSLKRKERREATRTAEKTMMKIEEIKFSINKAEHQIREAAGFRVRCPLLNEKGLCILYEYRPITCRIYGIPTSINGSGTTCGRSGFEKGKAYPTVNWDMIHAKVYAMSVRLPALASHPSAPGQDAEKLISVPKALLNDYSGLFKEVKHGLS